MPGSESAGLGRGGGNRFGADIENDGSAAPRSSSVSSEQ